MQITNINLNTLENAVFNSGISDYNVNKIILNNKLIWEKKDINAVTQRFLGKSWSYQSGMYPSIAVSDICYSIMDNIILSTKNYINYNYMYYSTLGDLITGCEIINGTFFAWANGYLYYSEDGENYTKKSALNNSISSMIYSNETYYVFGKGVISFTNDYTKSWNRVYTNLNSKPLKTIILNNSFYEIFDNGEIYVVSEDLRTLSKVSTINDSISIISSNSDLVVCVGKETNNIYYSTDMVNWNEKHIEVSKILFVHFLNNKWIILANNITNDKNIVFTSEDSLENIGLKDINGYSYITNYSSSCVDDINNRIVLFENINGVRNFYEYT